MSITEYRFDNFSLLIKQRQLLKGEQVIEISERGFNLLVLLAENSPTPLSKKSLHQALWPTTIVSDWSLSRLVSDTRIILGDDGEHQNIIKTARGEGFFMPLVEPITQKEEKHKLSIQRLKLSAIGFLVILLVSFGITWHKNEQQKQMFEAISVIAKHQDNSYSAFKAQANRRNQLVEMIEKRLGIKRQRQFEMFFQYYYSKMNDEEKFVCQQVRAFSDTGLYVSNLAIINAFESKPEIYQEIPLAKQLAQHLQIWLNKYDTVFKNREDMCLIYVGVEDGIPYPSGVDQEVKSWLQQH